MIEPISQYKVEVAPVFAELIRRLKWVERIDEMVSVKPEDCRVSVGMRVKALLLNILTDRKALYRVQRFYERQDIELLLGPGISAEALNDDALGRALDALARTGVDRVFTELALLALDHCEIPLEHLHFDTTSISVYGAYEDAHELGITYGYSKDHRPVRSVESLCMYALQGSSLALQAARTRWQAVVGADDGLKPTCNVPSHGHPGVMGLGYPGGLLVTRGILVEAS